MKSFRIVFIAILLHILILRVVRSGQRYDDENKDGNNDTRTKNKNTSRREDIREFIRSKRNEPIDDEELNEELEKEYRVKQQEARRNKLMKERKKMGKSAAAKIINASLNDNCDWRRQPWQFIKGELCGAHYKVLGLNRRDFLHHHDKAAIKRAHRQVSLLVHPDKNPSQDAQTAFKILQDAYECLIDDDCKEKYDLQLRVKEEMLLNGRREMKNRMLHKLFYGVEFVHYWISVAASYIDDFAMYLWDYVDDFQLNLFDHDVPIGRVLLVSLVYILFKPLLFLYSISFVVNRMNYELARHRGLF